MLLGHLRTTFKDTVIPLEGTEGAKMSSSAELKDFGGIHGGHLNSHGEMVMWSCAAATAAKLRFLSSGAAWGLRSGCEGW